jgi:aryl sulfotransferase
LDRIKGDIDVSDIIRGLPLRKKSYANVRIDSSRWDHYAARKGDVVVATYAKNGTTWMEHIVLHLIHRGPSKPTIHEVAVWVDRNKRREEKEHEDFSVDEMIEKLRQQTHQRQLKTHLPLDHLPFHTQVNYIVVGRPNRDVWLSWHNHYRNWLERGDLPEDPKDFWADWIEGRVAPQSDWGGETACIHPHFHYYQQWWSYRHLENILFVHFNDLLADLPSEVARVAEYLEIEVTDAEVQEIAHATTFGNMKSNADQLLPATKRADLFLNKGTNGRWRTMLTDADLLLYKEARQRALNMGVEKDCLNWLERDPA